MSALMIIYNYVIFIFSHKLVIYIEISNMIVYDFVSTVTWIYYFKIVHYFVKGSLV